MLETNPNVPTLGLAGIDQQDFKQLQLVVGGYPQLIGLQQRFPGKSLQQIVDGPVGSIYVFYNSFGRSFILTDFGSLQIVPVINQGITLPGLPPSLDEWFDDFSGYETGLVSRLWGAGIWDSGVGICETLIEGFIDPFLVFATLADLPAAAPTQEQKPIKVLEPVDDPEIPPADPNSPNYLYPPGHNPPDIILLNQTGVLIAAFGSEVPPQNINVADVVHFYDPPGGAIVDTFTATSVAVGHVANFHGARIGRMGDTDFGNVTYPPGDPLYNPDIATQPPANTKYFLNPDGTHGIET